MRANAWKTLASRAPLTLRMPLDTQERHRVAARLLGDAATVLDVGGVAGELPAFCPCRQVTVANVRPPADVIYDGGTLPFPAGAFEAVTSLDVLEHIERSRRRAHIDELVRVAARRVVLCSPLGTPEHVAGEHRLASWYTSLAGEPHPMLAQHLELGLPTEDELGALARGTDLRFQLLFHGDFRRTDELFRLGARARGSPTGLARYSIRRLLSRPDLALTSHSGPFTNRVFLVGERS
jgi:hypothetical protein